MSNIIKFSKKETYDFKAYKEAKVFCKHLEMILKVIDLSIRGLSCYRIYVPVKKILLVLEDQQSILKSHYDKQLLIRKNKGKL